MTIHKITAAQATRLFWKLGNRIADLTADEIEPTFEQVSLFNRLAAIRRRLVDDYSVDFRRRPAVS